MTPLDPIASPEGGVAAFLFFSAMAILAGVAVTALLRRLAAPAGETPYFLTSPRIRRALGTAISVAALVGVWFWLWSGYYWVTVAGDSVQLIYLAPPRMRTMAVSSIDRVTWIQKPKGQHALVIVTIDGTTYTSASGSVRPERREAIRREIEGAAGRTLRN